MNIGIEILNSKGTASYFTINNSYFQALKNLRVEIITLNQIYSLPDYPVYVLDEDSAKLFLVNLDDGTNFYVTSSDWFKCYNYVSKDSLNIKSIQGTGLVYIKTQ